jgi:hypothetical protein
VTKVEDAGARLLDPSLRIAYWSAMSIPRIAFLLLVLSFVALSATGCIMQRTVKDGDEVVAQGYVVKAPLIGR